MGKPFFKHFDRYDKPIGLTYKGAGTFESSAGGICSIITFFIFATWLSLEFVDVYMPPGKFTSSSGETLTQAEDGSYPIYNTTLEQLNIAYRAVSLNGTSLPQEEVKKYITPMWIQLIFDDDHDGHSSNETTTKYYHEKNCTLVFNETEQGPQFMEQIENMMCPDIPANETLEVKGGDHNMDVIADSTWFFVIDSCEHFQPITNYTDCKT